MVLTRGGITIPICGWPTHPVSDRSEKTLDRTQRTPCGLTGRVREKTFAARVGGRKAADRSRKAFPRTGLVKQVKGSKVFFGASSE